MARLDEVRPGYCSATEKNSIESCISTKPLWFYSSVGYRNSEFSSKHLPTSKKPFYSTLEALDEQTRQKIKERRHSRAEILKKITVIPHRREKK